MKKNSIISCPTPKELELDCLTNLQEDEINFQAELQQYYDKFVAPVLIKAVKHGAARFDGEIRYGGYVIPTLESKGWKVEWDNSAKAWIISKRTKKDVMARIAWARPFRAAWCMFMLINVIDYSQTLVTAHKMCNFGWAFAFFMFALSLIILSCPKIEA